MLRKTLTFTAALPTGLGAGLPAGLLVLCALLSACEPDIPGPERFSENDPCTNGSLPTCDDKNECTVDTCRPAGGCVHEATAGPCDDGNTCTVGDSCQGDSCEGGAPMNCDETTACRQSSGCKPGVGCEYAPRPNNPCDDSNACTNADKCDDKGNCVAGTKTVCDDNNPCTSNTCVAASGCATVNLADGATCKGNPCAVAAACTVGACKATKLKDCDDGNPCTNDACGGASGKCTHEAMNGGCDDGDACTQNDQCAGLTCKGNKVDCDDGNPCTDVACGADGKCKTTNNAAVCDDNNPCTKGDACAAGSCAPGKANPCDDGNLCTTDTCDGGNCEVKANPKMWGSACATGKVCVKKACVAPPIATMVPIPSGDNVEIGCTQGDTNCGTSETPRHAVSISAFWLDRSEVTVARYEACVAAGKCTVPSTTGTDCSDATKRTYGTKNMGSHPVNCVNWTQATAFCGWAVPGANLPTEAQFEYVLRNGKATSIFPWGNALPPPAKSGNFPDSSAVSWAGQDVVAQYTDGFSYTAPVGSFPLSSFGVHDMHGNLWEWTRDWFDASYFGISGGVSDPAGPTSGTFKVIRGSGFKHAQAGTALRTSVRLTNFQPGFANWDVGFRCAAVLK